VDHFVVSQNAIDTSKTGASERILSSSLVQAELLLQRRDIDELLAANANVENIASIAYRMRQHALTEAEGMFAPSA
jgi:hypothetical protein